MDQETEILELKKTISTLSEQLTSVTKNVKSWDGFQLREPLDPLTRRIMEDTTKDIRNTKRVSSITTSATPTPDSETMDMFLITALGSAATISAPRGNSSEGQFLEIRIKDNGTARALTWNAVYRASSDLALPTTTVLSKTMYLLFQRNHIDSKWDLVAYLDNF